MPYLRYLCLFAHSGIQHIFGCVFILFFFVLGTSFVRLYNFDCRFGIIFVYFPPELEQTNSIELMLGLWCLTALSTLFQNIVAVSFIGGGNHSTP